MIKIRKIKQLADGNVRVVIELPLSFPQRLTSVERTTLPATVTVDVPPDFIDERNPLLWVEKTIVEALHNSSYERMTVINASLRSY